MDGPVELALERTYRSSAVVEPAGLALEPQMDRMLLELVLALAVLVGWMQMDRRPEMTVEQAELGRAEQRR